MAAADLCHPSEIQRSIVRLSEHIKLHLRKSKVFSLSEVVVIIVMLSAGRTHGAEILYFLAFRKGELESSTTHTLEYLISVHNGKLDFIWLAKKDNLMLFN